MRQTRLLRPLMAFLVVALFAAALAAVPTARAAERVGDGIGDFGTCLASNKNGAIVLLMDQSGSLRQTDPQKDRIAASQYLARRLTAYATDSDVTLDVRVAGFAATYTPIGEWVTLSDQTLSVVEDDLTKAGNQIYDYDTDYWLALEGARQDLADHGSGDDVCRAIAWFTDGDFDIDPRESSDASQLYGSDKPYAPGIAITDESGAKNALELGKVDLCRPTGLADQLRASGITLLGIGLSQGDAQWPYLRSVILGGGSNADTYHVDQCGDLSSPAGTFVAATDIDSLFMAFDAISAPGRTSLSEVVEVCQGDVCTEGESRFVLDKSLRSVHIMSTTSVPNLSVLLFPPDTEEPLKLEHGSGDSEQTIAGVSFRWLTTKTLEVDFSSDTQKTWDGVWRIAFIDEASASKGKQVTVNVTLSSPLILEWMNLEQEQLRSGETMGQAQLSIVDGVGGDPVDISTLKGTLAASVLLKDSHGQSTVLFTTDNPQDLADKVSLQIGDIPLGPATVVTQLELATPEVTMKDGTIVAPTELLPAIVNESVLIEGPLNFPTVGRAVDFGIMDGVNKAEVSLPVNGPGCVWLVPDDTKLRATPGEAGEVVVTSTASSSTTCVEVNEGSTAELPLVLQTQSKANGQLAGQVSVALSPLDSRDAAKATVVDFSGDMRKPLDVGVAWIAFALVFAAGLGIPLLALYVIKARSSVFTPGVLAWGVTRAILPEEGSGASEVSMDLSKMTNDNIAKGSRRIKLASYELRTVMGLSPTTMPRAEVADSCPSISDTSQGQRKGRAQLPLALRGHWVAVLDQADSPKSVTLLVLSRSTDPLEVERILTDARLELAGAVKLVEGTVSPRDQHPKEGHLRPESQEPASVFSGPDPTTHSSQSPFADNGPFSS